MRSARQVEPSATTCAATWRARRFIRVDLELLYSRLRVLSGGSSAPRLVLVAAVLVGLGLGAAFCRRAPRARSRCRRSACRRCSRSGRCPARARRRAAPGLILLGLHLALASLPLALVGLAIGLDDPLGFGLFLIAAAPPAALIPAYADVAEVPGGDLLVFVLIAYGLALVLTPALVYLAAGELVGLGPIALTLGAGLVAPAVLARALHPQIARIPQRVRRGCVNSTVVVICFGLGGGLFKGLGSDDFTMLTLGVVVVALVARSTAGAALATRIAPSDLKTEAPFAVAFRTSPWRPPWAVPVRSGRRAARPRRVPDRDPLLPVPCPAPRPGSAQV